MWLNYKLFLILIVYFLVFTACEKNTTDVQSKRANLSVSLTDAPAAYDSVVIVFSEISAHIDSEWVHVLRDPVRVNLLDWNNGKTFLLGSADVPAGKYTQIRVIIDSAFVGVDGNLLAMDVPSGAQTGLKLGPQFTINEGSTYHLIMDFDASRSIVVMGPPKNPKGYKLKPHIRLITEAVSGSISGTIANPEHIPFAFAIAGADTLTSTAVDTANGTFMLAFLPADIYTISVLDTSGYCFTQDSVQVLAGDNTDIGLIRLE